MIVYIVCDIEADGPIPGPYSMISLGAVAIDKLGTKYGEFEINLEVTWTLIHQNESIIESVQYKEMGDYSFNRNQILGKTNESTFIKESLANQLAEKIFLRMNEVL